MTYHSTGVRGFTILRMIILLLLPSLALAVYLSHSFLVFFALFLSFYVGLPYAYCSARMTRMTKTKDDLTVSNLNRRIQLKGDLRTETWWNYDFTKSSRVIGSDNPRERRSRANKINVFLKITDITGQSVILSEQIYLSSKFPNNHKYDNRREDDYNTPRFKIWDVDRCIARLGL